MPDGYIRMISEARHEYAGRWHEPGQEFDCQEKDVPVMLALGRARTIVSGPKNGSYETRVMTAGRGRRTKTIQ